MTTPIQQPEEEKLSALQSILLNRKLIEAEILARAWSDADFRLELEADPSRALANAGIALPEDKPVRVVPEDRDTFHIILPPKPEATSDADDSELAAVAGGGLIDTGKCQLYQNAGEKADYRPGFAFTFGVLVGVSLGHS